YQSDYEKGTLSNEYGFYSLNIPTSPDSVDIRISYVGYADRVVRVLADRDQKLDVYLSSGVDLEEVVVKAESDRDRMNSTEMSVTTINVREAKLLPALFGEVDILKTVQL